MIPQTLKGVFFAAAVVRESFVPRQLESVVAFVRLRIVC